MKNFVDSFLTFLPMGKILLPVTKLTSKKMLWAGTWLSLCPCIHHWWSEAVQRIMLFHSIVLHSENRKKILKDVYDRIASVLTNTCCLLENSWVTEGVLGQFSAVSLMLGASMKEVLSGFQRLCKISLDLNPDNRTGTKFLVMKSLAFDPPLCVSMIWMIILLPVLSAENEEMSFLFCRWVHAITWSVRLYILLLKLEKGNESLIWVFCHACSCSCIMVVYLSELRPKGHIPAQQLAVFKTPLGKDIDLKLLKAAISGVFLGMYYSHLF